MKLRGVWHSLWKLSAMVSLVGAAATVVGYFADPSRFAFSYLFAFITFLTVSLGALFFVLLQHLTSASWSVTVRRTAENLTSALPLMALLFIPVLLSAHALYPWLSHGQEHSAIADVQEERVEHGLGHEAHEAHEARAEHGSGQHAPTTLPEAREAAEHNLHARVIAGKAAYLQYPRFVGFAILYFAVWIIIGRYFRRKSIRQDSASDPALTRSMQRAAPVSLMLLALTVTFAAFDWLMSLQPAWYSTIYGVYIFAGSMVAALSVLTLMTLALHRSRLVNNAINVEHFHDLGKLLFGFLVFWAYIAFSQLLLIWYAGIPEETTYYHLRWLSPGWRATSMLLLLGKFVVPFFFLLSRNVKRRLGMLGLGAAWIAAMHVVDMYWFVLPHFRENHFGFHLLDMSCFLTVGGAFLAVVLFRMRRHALVPIGDPRLPRSLAFHNA